MATMIRDVLADRRLVEVAPDATVRTAGTLLRANDIGALAVIEDGRVIGILSESDIVERVGAVDAPACSTPVRAIKTPDPVTIRIDESLHDAHRRMKGGRISAACR